MKEIIEKIKKLFSVEKLLGKNKVLGDLPTEKEVYSRAFRISWPCTLETVLVGLVGSVDIMMVGTLGSSAIAAVGLTNQPKYLLLALIRSLNVGVTAISARRKGENDYLGANRCLKESIVLSFIISMTMAVLGYFFAGNILKFAGAGEDIINDSVAYYEILMISIVFTSLSLTMNAAQRGIGKTKISMKTNVMANIFNLIFDYLLINGVWGFPKLGIRGAAVATVIGSIVAFLMSVKSLLKKGEFLELKLKGGWRFDRKTTASLINISGSAAIEQLFMRMGFFSYAKIVAGLGTVAFAVHQICMNMIDISFYCGEGLGTAAASLVGQNLGARRPDKAIIYGKANQRMSTAVSITLFFLFIFGRRFLISIFNSEPDVVALGSQVMLLIAVTTLVQTSQTVFMGCLRGAGDTKFVAGISIFSIGILRPFTAWLFIHPMNLGLMGAWISLSLDQLIRYILGRARFNSGKWTKIKV